MRDGSIDPFPRLRIITQWQALIRRQCIAKARRCGQLRLLCSFLLLSFPFMYAVEVSMVVYFAFSALSKAMVTVYENSASIIL